MNNRNYDMNIDRSGYTYSQENNEKNDEKEEWDKKGINKVTGSKYNVDGYDKEGIDIYGRKREDKSKENDEKLRKWGINMNNRNYDMNIDRSGYIYSQENNEKNDEKEEWDEKGINKVTGSKYNVDGYDKEGIDIYGYKKEDKEGLQGKLQKKEQEKKRLEKEEEKIDELEKLIDKKNKQK